MLRLTGISLALATLCLVLGRAAPALPPPSAVSSPGGPHGSTELFDVGDVSATWSATVIERDCLANGTCPSTPVSSETDTYRATWPMAGEGGLSFDAGLGVQEHHGLCRDGTGGKRVFPIVPGTLSMKLSGAQAGVHLETGWDCAETQGAFDEIGVTPSTFDAAHLVTPSALQRTSLPFSYTGSHHYQGVTQPGTTVIINTTWKVSVRYVTRCQGVSVEQSRTSPARFVRSWGHAPFCILFDSRGLPPAPARRCEAQVAKVGTFTCRPGPKVTLRSLNVCDLMSTADQQRLQGSQTRNNGEGSTAPSADECVYVGPNGRGQIDVHRFIAPPWPNSVANELTYARLLKSMGLAKFTTFATPGGGKAIVVHGTRPWETWAYGEKHGELLSLQTYGPGDPYLTRLGPRLDQILRTLLARF